MTWNPPSGRRLHLVDVENLAGCARPTGEQVAACCRFYADLVEPAAGDHYVVACNHGAGAAVGFNWPGVRNLWRSGPDGADRALLDVLAWESVSERFGAVVLASGDGVFAEPVAQLAGLGVQVTVVANQASLSRRVRLAASRVVVFDTIPFPAAGPELGEAA